LLFWLTRQPKKQLSRRDKERRKKEKRTTTIQVLPEGSFLCFGLEKTGLAEKWKGMRELSLKRKDLGFMFSSIDRR